LAAASSSAPERDPADADEATQAQQRAEALAWAKLRKGAVELWRIKAVEVNHVMAHHPIEQARTILWRARRPAGATVMAAAG
jgi:hypothetical protein